MRKILLSSLLIASMSSWSNDKPLDLFENIVQGVKSAPYYLQQDRTKQAVGVTQFDLSKFDSISEDSPLSVTSFTQNNVFFIKRLDLIDEQRKTLVAYSKDEVESISLAINGKHLVGNIRSKQGLYQLKTLEDGKVWIFKVDDSSLRDHADEYIEEAIKPYENAAENELDPQNPVDRKNTDSGDEYTVIVAYTAGFSNVAGNIQAYMDLLETETNDSYANSQVNTRVNIVHHYQTGYADSGDFYTDRTYFRNQSNTHAQELNNLRDTHNADLMIVLTGNGYSFCGIANEIGANADGAFGFARESCATGYYSFGHEIGHLFGARHIRHTDPSTTPFAYGHGYCNVTANTWRTVMAYGCPSGTGGPRIQQWSNPNVQVNNQVTGTAAHEDNARVLNTRAHEVANFRVSQQSDNLAWLVPIVTYIING
ncbi:M12 family metallo-peptidase [Pleionea sp. CnH1-48]|uniref:M12 family metallo-peptidase n=1 Tax=Pleionea sp. CnH1-48 TaxID=2954494 RepID=UPI002097D56B|nr:M12 family metallo-peptidase [Pleionea sp. CnH1-48]MCO7223395.1 zinc-dependent metalloprotease [Pleionea sp. CnH1-48]